MISCVVIVLLISVPEGSFQVLPDDFSTTLSTFKQTTEIRNPSSTTARLTTDHTTHQLTTVQSTAQLTTEHSTARLTTVQSAAQLTTEHSTAQLTTEHLKDQSTTVNPSGQLTTKHLASQSTVNRLTSTTDQSSTNKTVSEQTSPSQTTLEELNSNTINQTTQFPVTKSTQTTSQSTQQPNNSTVQEPYEPTTGTKSPAEQNNATSIIALEGKGEKFVVGNPGLIAVLCIFFSTLAMILVIVIVKVVQARRPQFERLDDLPMGGITEDAPFARYRSK